MDALRNSKRISLLAVAILFLFTFFNLILDARSHIPVVIEDPLHPGGGWPDSARSACHSPVLCSQTSKIATLHCSSGLIQTFSTASWCHWGGLWPSKAQLQPLFWNFFWDFLLISTNVRLVGNMWYSTFCFIENNARGRVFILGQWNLVIFTTWSCSFICHWFQSSIFSRDQDIQFLRQDLPRPLFVEMVFIAFWRFSPCLYWNMLNVQICTMGRKMLNYLTIRSSSSW